MKNEPHLSTPLHTICSLAHTENHAASYTTHTRPPTTPTHIPSTCTHTHRGCIPEIGPCCQAVMGSVSRRMLGNCEIRGIWCKINNVMEYWLCCVEEYNYCTKTNFRTVKNHITITIHCTPLYPTFNTKIAKFWNQNNTRTMEVDVHVTFHNQDTTGRCSRMHYAITMHYYYYLLYNLRLLPECNESKTLSRTIQCRQKKKKSRGNKNVKINK